MRHSWRETLPVAALTAVGVALRIVVAHQSLFADELSTYWISATHSLGGVLSLMYGTGRITHAEITPPLYFLAAWLTSQVSHSAELLRLPSLIAGTATIPLVYLLGRRVMGAARGLIACALTALSPFMIYYSAEARAYAVMMLLLTLSTLSMLLALDTGRRRWWVIYALCSSAAFLTHYTSLFVLGAQLAWLFWRRPDARRHALLANGAAALCITPWIPGLINNLHSPTVNILSAEAGFTPHDVQVGLSHWAIGYPYAFAGSIKDLPGVPALVLLGIAALLIVCVLARRTLRARVLPLPRESALLLLALAAAAPLGAAVVSAGGNHIFGARNIAASWPYAALCSALLLAAAGPRLRVLAAALAVAAFALGAARELSSNYRRPDYSAAASYLRANARPADVIIDGTGTVDPGPLTPLDISLRTRAAVIRALAPAERDHPFSIVDPAVQLPQALRLARTKLAPTGRLFIVLTAYRNARGSLALARIPPAVPMGNETYRISSTVRYPGTATVEVHGYSRGA